MNIDDIIRKSMEVPGISIKRGNFSVELLLREKEGKGSMTFFPLFPGLTIAYIFVNSPAWTAPDFRGDNAIEKGPLLLNYCVTGRCEMILNNENFVYVKDGEISLTERFAQKQYVYPRRVYEGSLEENIAYSKKYDKAKMEKIIQTTGLSDLKGRVLKKDQVSGGEKQRIALARAIYSGRKLIIMDEPDKHLDRETLEWLDDFIINGANRMIYVSHKKSLVQMAEQIITL